MLGEMPATRRSRGSPAEQSAAAISALMDAENDRLLNEIKAELARQPKKIKGAHPLIMSDMLLRDAGTVDEDAQYNATLCRLQGLPKKDASKVLHDYRPQIFTEARLEDINKADRGAVMRIFHYLSGTNPNFPWGVEAHLKAFLPVLFLRRMNELDRAGSVRIGGDGAVTITCYKLLRERGAEEDEPFKMAKHLPTGEEAPTLEKRFKQLKPKCPEPK